MTILYVCKKHIMVLIFCKTIIEEVYVVCMKLYCIDSYVFNFYCCHINVVIYVMEIGCTKLQSCVFS